MNSFPNQALQLMTSTLQSLNLPGSIQALERPVGLPPSLLKKAEEVDAAGGTSRILHLLGEASRLSQQHTSALSEVGQPAASVSAELIDRRWTSWTTKRRKTRICSQDNLTWHRVGRLRMSPMRIWSRLLRSTKQRSSKPQGAMQRSDRSGRNGDH